MKKIFNINGDCKPDLHYMVDMSEPLLQIKKMVDAGQYFTINRARQYGKTTTLRALEKILAGNYIVISLDFQLVSDADFDSEESFVAAFSREILDVLEGVEGIPQEAVKELDAFSKGEIVNATLSVLFGCIKRWCGKSEKRLC